jgi:hypothetical protein
MCVLDASPPISAHTDRENILTHAMPPRDKTATDRAKISEMSAK